MQRLSSLRTFGTLNIDMLSLASFIDFIRRLNQRHFELHDNRITVFVSFRARTPHNSNDTVTQGYRARMNIMFELRMDCARELIEQFIAILPGAIAYDSPGELAVRARKFIGSLSGKRNEREVRFNNRNRQTMYREHAVRVTFKLLQRA